MASGKYYVVWNGLHTGIFPSWEECKAQIQGFPNAKYKAFASKEEAIEAYRGDASQHLDILRSIVTRQKSGGGEGRRRKPSIADFPEIRRDAIAVDGACSGSPGPVEYRGVRVDTGEEIFRHSPMNGGSNNMGEYLALVHALAWLHQRGDTTTPVYVDSVTSLAWFRNRGHRSTIKPNEGNAEIFELLRRADAWLQNHPVIPNPVLKWKTELWGEIPADFGRK